MLGLFSYDFFLIYRVLPGSLQIIFVSKVAIVRPQFVDTLFIVRLIPNMPMRRALIINY